MRIRGRNFDLGQTSIDYTCAEYIDGEGAILPICYEDSKSIERYIRGLKLLRYHCPIEMLYIFVMEESRCGIVAVKYTDGFVFAIDTIGETDLAVNIFRNN